MNRLHFGSDPADIRIRIIRGNPDSNRGYHCWLMFGSRDQVHLALAEECCLWVLPSFCFSQFLALHPFKFFYIAYRNWAKDCWSLLMRETMLCDVTVTSPIGWTTLRHHDVTSPWRQHWDPGDVDDRDVRSVCYESHDRHRPDAGQRHDQRWPWMTLTVTLTKVSATTTSVVRPASVRVDPETLTTSGRPRHFRSTRQPLSLSNSKKEDQKEKRIKKTVMVIAAFMILASFVLVGASLSMSDHIDEMGEFLFACFLCSSIDSFDRRVRALTL